MLSNLLFLLSVLFWIGIFTMDHFEQQKLDQ